MSVSFAFNITLLWMLFLFAATIFNYIKSSKDMFFSSAFILAMYGVGHLSNSLWLMSLPLNELLNTHYLFYAGMQLMLAAGLFFINRHRLRVIMIVTVVLLGVEALLGYAVHIDRNVLALNGAEVPNTQGIAAWWLWDMRDMLSQITNFTLFLAITLPRIYQVTTEDPTEAYDEAEDVEAYLEKFKPSERVAKAKAFANLAAENLCFHDGIEKNQHKAMAGTMLLNEAIKQCCYEPGKTAPVGFFGRFVYWLRS